MRRTMFVSLCLIVALGLAGVAYAEWNTNLGVVGSVGTGTLSMDVSPLELAPIVGATKEVPCDPMTVQITNTGSLPLTFSNITKSGTENLEIQTELSTDRLEPGSSGYITIQLTPKRSADDGQEYRFSITFHGIQDNTQENGRGWETAPVTINGSVAIARERWVEITDYYPHLDDVQLVSPSLRDGVLEVTWQAIKNNCSATLTLTIANKGSKEATLQESDLHIEQIEPEAPSTRWQVNVNAPDKTLPAGQKFDTWQITFRHNSSHDMNVTYRIRVE